MKSNSIRIIEAYKYKGQWVFDDEAVGLEREAFVAGADTLIDKVTGGVSKKTVVILFSDTYMKDFTITIEKLPQNTSEVGTDYYCPELKHYLWLCPSLLKYFDTPPNKIWVKFK